jgi:predicted RNA-binding protein
VVAYPLVLIERGFMAYYLDLFSPLTYKAFLSSPRDITGFRPKQKNAASKLKPGDVLICYLTKVSRWVGALEITSEMFEDSTPRFVSNEDPFVIRFKVKPLVLLEPKFGIPIREDVVWNNLSFTTQSSKEGSQWTGPLRSSLKMIDKNDGGYLLRLLKTQSQTSQEYPLDEEHYEKYLTRTTTVHQIDVPVSIPEDTDNHSGEVIEEKEVRESIKIQALLALIGEKMGFKIWLPRNDRNLVLQEWKPEGDVLLNTLPLNYDVVTIKTIEQTDVLWLKRRSIIRAFEIEHTTSIYSGILRMADLLALQPNMDIKLHIVAPEERKEKVFSEIQRPVFSLLEKGALSEYCTYLSYDSIRELSREKHLGNLTHTVLEDYEENVE